MKSYDFYNKLKTMLWYRDDIILTRSPFYIMHTVNLQSLQRPSICNFSSIRVLGCFSLSMFFQLVGNGCCKETGTSWLSVFVIKYVWGVLWPQILHWGFFVKAYETNFWGNLFASVTYNLGFIFTSIVHHFPIIFYQRYNLWNHMISKWLHDNAMTSWSYDFDVIFNLHCTYCKFTKMDHF